MNKNITLILGAGASCDYGFPTGEELSEMISDPNIINDLIKDVESIEDYVKRTSLIHGLELIKEHFFKSRIKSIDAWLAKEENKECVEAAKLVISDCITRSEIEEFSKAGFFKKQYKGSRNDWYQEFFNVLVTDEFEKFPKTDDKLSIITFNYDISLEYFLLMCLQNTYIGRTYEDCWKRLQNINIFHVYGSLGCLPIEGADESLIFGKTHNWSPNHKLDVILRRSENLSIIPELRSASSEIVKQIKVKLSESDLIFFIGFSYDALNLQLLGFPFESERGRLKISGTVYRMEDGEIEKAKSLVHIPSINGSKRLETADPGCDAYTFFRREIVKYF